MDDPSWVQGRKVLSPLGNLHRPGLQPQIPANRHRGPIANRHRGPTANRHRGPTAEQKAYGTCPFLTGFSSSRGDFKYTSAFVSNFETQECVPSHQPACTRHTGIHLDGLTTIHVRNRIPDSILTEPMEKAAGRYWEDLGAIRSKVDQRQDLGPKILTRNLTNIITGKKNKKKRARKEAIHFENSMTYSRSHEMWKPS